MFFHHYTQELQNIKASGVQTNLKSLKSPWVFRIFSPHFSLFYENTIPSISHRSIAKLKLLYYQLE